jgi:hypothetical protein
LAADMRRKGAPLPTRLGVVALYAAAPALLEAVYYGHPEEPLGAALTVAAVLVAASERPVLAGCLLGAAVINKPWGVFALGPVLLCAPRQHLRVLLPAGAIVGGWFTVAAVTAPSRFLLAVHGAETSIVAHPQDLWWPLAHTVGFYPLPPAIISAHARQLAVVLALVTAVALAIRARRSRTPLSADGALALLAFGFALRCLLEPATHDYYQLPFVVALAAWETRARRSVAISLVATVVLAFDFGRLDEYTGAIPFAVYLAVLLPICALLSGELLGGAWSASGNRTSVRPA